MRKCNFTILKGQNYTKMKKYKKQDKKTNYVNETSALYVAGISPENNSTITTKYLKRTDILDEIRNNKKSCKVLGYMK